MKKNKIEIIFPGIPPSKKNSKIIVCRGKIPTLLPSKAYKKWWEESLFLLNGINPIKGGNLNFNYYFKIPYNKDGSISKRPFDYSNKIESINDFLVDNGIIEDDNYIIIKSIFIDSELINGEGEIKLTITKGD